MVEKTIAVIDMRAFYSYVECVDRGLDPWKAPLVVCDKDRGTNTIILSVTPYLKSQGVPSRLRYKDLPRRDDYIYAVPRMSRYLERSSFVMSIILKYIDEEDLHVYSIDEAFLNLGPYLSYYKMSAVELIKVIKEDIYKQTKLECTSGISSNMFLAKIALDNFAKKEKNGIALFKKEDIPTKLWPIEPLSKMWGIGQALERRLNYFGIYTVGDLASANREFIRQRFGIIGEELIDHANGIDESDIREKYVPKETSLSQGQTLFKDYNYEETKLIIRELLDDLLLRLRLSNQLAGGIALFIGYSRGTGGFSKQMSLIRHSDNNSELYSALMRIYDQKMDRSKMVRQVSVSVFKLKPVFSTVQIDLFTPIEEEDKNRELQYTIDDIQMKFGKDSILRGSALLEDSTIKERHSYIGGHKK